MAESDGQEKAQWITTVIMSSSLQVWDQQKKVFLHTTHNYPVKFTPERCLMGTKFGVAFLLADVQDLFLTNREPFFDKIKKFMTIHRNGFLLLSAALHGSKEWDVMFRIQQRFLGSNLRIIPVHNTAEAVKLMLTVAKTTSKPHVDSVRYRMLMAKTQIVEQSPVWKMLHQSQLDCSLLNTS